LHSRGGAWRRGVAPPWLAVSGLELPR
jgi:hypothetical protein